MEGVIELPEFVVPDDAVTNENALLMKQLAAAIHQMDGKGFDLEHGGKFALNDSDRFRLTLGNDDQQPGFSIGLEMVSRHTAGLTQARRRHESRP